MTATTELRSEYDLILAMIAGPGAHFEGIVAALRRQWNFDPREAASSGASLRCS